MACAAAAAADSGEELDEDALEQLVDDDDGEGCCSTIRELNDSANLGNREIFCCSLVICWDISNVCLKFVILRKDVCNCVLLALFFFSNGSNDFSISCNIDTYSVKLSLYHKLEIAVH